MPSSSGVREFRRDDLAAVAALWLRVFRGRSGPAPLALQEYFERIFFDGPWRDEALPSLVYEERGRGIAGFIGVLPRPMRFRGRAVKAAVALQLAAERGMPYVGAKLMRRFHAGGQDLSFSDGANAAAQELWQAAGGGMTLLHSLVWTRALRPAQSVLERLGAARPLAAAALRPLARSADAAFGASRWGRIPAPEASGVLVDEAPDDATLLWCIRRLSGERALRPEYGAQDFGWLLARAAEKQQFGPLARGVVRSADGAILGWFLYHARRGGTAQVLQFGGRPQTIHQVLGALFHGARRRGALAVCGGLEPRFVRELAAAGCTLGWGGCRVLAHSRDAEILHAIHRGDAFLTRLEGEWWAHFSDPRWSHESAAMNARDGGARRDRAALAARTLGGNT